MFQSLFGVPVSVPFGVPDFPGLKFIAMYRLKGGVPVFMSTSSKGMGNEKAYVPAIGHTHLPRFIGSVGKAAETGTREHGQLTLSASITSGVHVSSQAEIETGTLEHTSRPALFVSTGLAFWATERPYVFARDVQVDDIEYRRLDPQYFAWLRSRMVAVRAAVDSGRVTAAAFEELRQSFWAVQEWALDTFGEATLRDAISRLDAAAYRPPVPEPSEPRSRPTR